MPAIVNHPQHNTIRLQLKQNLILREMAAAAWNELEPQLEISECRKGEPLVRQGGTNMEQFFIVEGILKRVVSNPQGKEMILRFAAETDMDTSYAAWRLKTPMPYSIAAVTKNWRVLIGWGALIVLFTAAGLVTLYVGLALTLPLIGHASWHAYRDLVGTDLR